MRNLNGISVIHAHFLTDDLQGRSQRIGNNSDIGNRLPACTETFPISLLERRAINHTNPGVKLACVASVYAWFKRKVLVAPEIYLFSPPLPATILHARFLERDKCWARFPKLATQARCKLALHVNSTFFSTLFSTFLPTFLSTFFPTFFTA